MGLGDNPDDFLGPDRVGANPGHEVVLFEWANWIGARIVRFISHEQLDAALQAMETSLSGGYGWNDDYVFFGLQRWSPSKGWVYKTVLSVRDMSVPGFREEWLNALDLQGVERWSVEHIATDQSMPGCTHQIGLDNQSHGLVVSFLFGFLGINPQYMRAYVRIYCEVPFATKMLPTRPPPMPGGDANYEYDKTEEFRNFMVSLARAWLSGPDGDLATFWSFKKHNMVWLNNRFVDLEVHWKLGTQLTDSQPEIYWKGPINPDLLKMYYRVRYGAVTSMWQSGASTFGPWETTPEAAVKATGALTTDRGLEEWLDKHYEWLDDDSGGISTVDEDIMDGLQLLGDDLPQLMPVYEFLEFLHAQGALPWM